MGEPIWLIENNPQWPCLLQPKSEIFSESPFSQLACFPVWCRDTRGPSLVQKCPKCQFCHGLNCISRWWPSQFHWLLPSRRRKEIPPFCCHPCPFLLIFYPWATFVLFMFTGNFNRLRPKWPEDGDILLPGYLQFSCQEFFLFTLVQFKCSGNIDSIVMPLASAAGNNRQRHDSRIAPSAATIGHGLVTPS